MTDFNAIASNYIATWNATDAAARDTLIADHWSDAPHYVDPLMAATGRDELSAIIGAVHGRFPGFRFSLLGNPDGHGEYLRFSWGLGPEGAAPVIEGSDVVGLENGRMRQVVGFLDKVPEAG